jgi:hypothetical protein
MLRQARQTSRSYRCVRTGDRTSSTSTCVIATRNAPSTEEWTGSKRWCEHCPVIVVRRSRDSVVHAPELRCLLIRVYLGNQVLFSSLRTRRRQPRDVHITKRVVRIVAGSGRPRSCYGVGLHRRQLKRTGIRGRPDFTTLILAESESVPVPHTNTSALPSCPP